MPRSRSRSKHGRRAARTPEKSDSLVLLDLLQMIEDDSYEDARPGELIGASFSRAAWTFHAGPPGHDEDPTSREWALARLRAREWYLFEFELESGLTPAEEWVLDLEGTPGTANRRRAVERLVNGQCGVFDVLEVGEDGRMVLAPLPDGETVSAWLIDDAYRMLEPTAPPLLQFQQGDTIAGRLFWREAGPMNQRNS
jgi:hypothetical protein